MRRGDSQSRAERDAAFRRAVEQAKERKGLSDIIGRHTNLKRRGRELVGLCPFHSEKTPSFEVNDAKGFYHCHGCGAGGDHFRFLRDKEGMTFREALEALTGDRFPDVPEEERARRKAEDEALTARRREVARGIWSRTVPIAGTPGEVYARSRGITALLPATVRFVMTPRYINLETGETGRDHPAVACALQDAGGAVVGVQCIFLADGGRSKYHWIKDDGTAAKAKLTFGNIVGSALRLGPVQSEITLCEGPEDGWTLMQRFPGRSVWVACGTALMSRVVFPGEVSAVALGGDNGTAGRRAVGEATEAYFGQGLAVSDFFPATDFKDFNDELRGIRA